MKKDVFWADLGLLLTAVIWGAGFSATQYAIDAGLPASMILLMRFSIAALVMGVACARTLRTIPLSHWLRGALSGLFLFLAFFFQTEGQGRTTPSNCAFITSTNVLMVPFIVWAVSHRRPGLRNVVLPILTLIGVFLLSYEPKAGFSFSIGDLMSLVCAFFFACHIASLDGASERIEARSLTFVQLFTAAVLSLLYYLLADRSPVSAEMLGKGALPVLYLGLLSTCACYFLQTACQRYADATKAAIFLSAEGLFGALFSLLLGLESFRWTMAVGGGLIFLTVLLTEVHPRTKSAY